MEQESHVVKRPKIKLWKTILMVLLAIPIVLAAVLATVYLYADNRRDIKSGYNREIVSGGVLEAKYLAGGNFGTKKITAKAEAPISKYTVYYPEELEETCKTYPMILVLNGTGGKATKYEAQFELYASWGFIVVGNQDKATGTGATAVETLRYMLEQNETPKSVFYHKIDLDNIGLTGFSQGGAGIFNVLTKYEEASYFKAAVPLSPVSEYMTALVTDYTYDSSEVKIPIMIFAGTEGEFELETVLLSTPFKNAVFSRNEMSFFAGQHAGVYSLDYRTTCRLEARQVLIYQCILDLTGENDKYNHSKAAHLYPPFSYIPRSAKNYKIEPALTTAACRTYAFRTHLPISRPYGGLQNTVPPPRNLPRGFKPVRFRREILRAFRRLVCGRRVQREGKFFVQLVEEVLRRTPAHIF